MNRLKCTVRSCAALAIGLSLTLSQNAFAGGEDFIPSKDRGKRIGLELGGYALGTLGGAAVGLGAGYLEGKLITAGRGRGDHGEEFVVLALMVAGGLAGAATGGMMGVYEAGSIWGHANGKLWPTFGGTLVGDVVGVAGLFVGGAILSDADTACARGLGASLVGLGLVSFIAGPIIGYELSTRTQRAETSGSFNALTFPREHGYSFGVAF